MKMGLSRVAVRLLRPNRDYGAAGDYRPENCTRRPSGERPRTRVAGES